MSWKWPPFPFKCYPTFPVSSHISPLIHILSANLGQLAGQCELNWQNSPANGCHTTVSALKIGGPCFTEMRMMKSWMWVSNANKEPELIKLTVLNECFLFFNTHSPYVMGAGEHSSSSLNKGEQVCSLHWPDEGTRTKTESGRLANYDSGIRHQDSWILGAVYITVCSLPEMPFICIALEVNRVWSLTFLEGSPSPSARELLVTLQNPALCQHTVSL